MSEIVPLHPIDALMLYNGSTWQLRLLSIHNVP